MERAELKAYVQSPGGWGWVGDARHHQRYAKPVDKPRSHMRYCGSCKDLGVKKRADYAGCVNGLWMMVGCEFHVRQWVRA